LRKESYDASVWVLFINRSKRSLKAVLLHDGNNVASIPIAHSIHLNETYENLRIVLEKINWNLCGNMKILGTLLGQQSFHVSCVNGWQNKGHTLDKKMLA
jgi:predicted  nucleic acid-binding Zn ribbon protein